MTSVFPHQRERCAQTSFQITPAKAVHVFLDGLWVGKGSPWQTRPDVGACFDDRRSERSGFSVYLKMGREQNLAAL